MNQKSKIAAMMTAMFGGGHSLTSGFKLPRMSNTYPHHSDGECARRRRQTQHMKQVRIDRETKRQPG